MSKTNSHEVNVTNNKSSTKKFKYWWNVENEKRKINIDWNNPILLNNHL